MPRPSVPRCCEVHLPNIKLRHHRPAYHQAVLRGTLLHRTWGCSSLLFHCPIESSEHMGGVCGGREKRAQAGTFCDGRGILGEGMKRWRTADTNRSFPAPGDWPWVAVTLCWGSLSRATGSLTRSQGCNTASVAADSGPSVAVTGRAPGQQL